MVRPYLFLSMRDFFTAQLEAEHAMKSSGRASLPLEGGREFVGRCRKEKKEKEGRGAGEGFIRGTKHASGELIGGLASIG